MYTYDHNVDTGTHHNGAYVHLLFHISILSPINCQKKSAGGQAFPLRNGKFFSLIALPCLVVSLALHVYGNHNATYCSTTHTKLAICTPRPQRSGSATGYSKQAWSQWTGSWLELPGILFMTGKLHNKLFDLFLLSRTGILVLSCSPNIIFDEWHVRILRAWY